MTFPPNSEDRPDPFENMPAVRARVPDHVASGEISTGVIVVTGGTEYVLDFVRNLPRPNCVVSRVVLPHLVMPQFIDALTTNIDLFRQRYGELPGSQPTATLPIPNSPVSTPPPASDTANSGASQDSHRSDADSTGASTPGFGSMGASSHLNGPSDPLLGEAANNADKSSSEASGSSMPSGGVEPTQQPANPQAPRRQNPQDVYDDLKIRDEILSGAYANAVMIGHGPYEFSFDFITQFYPQPAVSARVFMASGHVGRLLDSLKTSWEQIRGRYGYPPKS